MSEQELEKAAKAAMKVLDDMGIPSAVVTVGTGGISATSTKGTIRDTLSQVCGAFTGTLKYVGEHFGKKLAMEALELAAKEVMNSLGETIDGI